MDESCAEHCLGRPHVKFRDVEADLSSIHFGRRIAIAVRHGPLGGSILYSDAETGAVQPSSMNSNPYLVVDSTNGRLVSLHEDPDADT